MIEQDVRQLSIDTILTLAIDAVHQANPHRRRTP
jgi:hypothetical protein